MWYAASVELNTLTDRSELTVRLAVAVHGDNARPPVNADDYDLDTLLWKVGEMRRQIEAAQVRIEQVFNEGRREGQISATGDNP